MTADWYFDIISPFAYLQFERLDELPADLEINFRPVLLAGLLNHWGQRGPAEIEPKRLFTYRHVMWLAERRGVAMRLPAAHPFNPLPLLRLAVIVGDDRARLGRLFGFVWREGHIPEHTEELLALADEIGVPDAATELISPPVKEALKDNGARAISAGVFGVPTFVIDGLVFWGDDATSMVADYCANPGLFGSEEMRRVETLPQSASRV